MCVRVNINQHVCWPGLRNCFDSRARGGWMCKCIKSVCTDCCCIAHLIQINTDSISKTHIHTHIPCDHFVCLLLVKFSNVICTHIHKTSPTWLTMSKVYNMSKSFYVSGHSKRKVWSHLSERTQLQPEALHMNAHSQFRSVCLNAGPQGPLPCMF